MFARYICSLLLCFTISETLYGEVVKIALLHDVSSEFIERVYSGLDRKVKKLADKHNIYFQYDKTHSIQQMQKALVKYSRQGFDLIIYAGDDRSGYLSHVARQYPKVRYLFIDGLSQGANISSVRFQDSDVGFIMGYVSALNPTTKKISIIAPTDRMEISGILRPFKQGVKLVNPEIELSESFLSNEESVWNDSKGLSAEVFNKLKQGYRSFFIIASKGELEWARTSNLLSKYNNVNVSIYGRKQKIKMFL